MPRPSGAAEPAATALTVGSDGRPAVTIYHNPRCPTSRNTLELIRQAGIEPEIVDYVKTPLGRPRLVDLMKRAGLKPKDLIRQKEKMFAQMELGRAGMPEKELIDAMVAHPALMNRPLVVTSKGVRLCRPADRVLDILPSYRGTSGNQARPE